MTQIETLKAQANNLKHAMARMGTPISLAQALEAIAQQYGLENWDTLAGIVNASEKSKRPTELVDQLDGLQCIEVKGCSGLRSFCSVIYLDKEAFAYLHDNRRLQQYLSENPKKYPADRKAIALRVRSIDRDFEFSFAELVGIHCEDEYWYLASGLMALRFHCDQATEPATRSDLAIPQMVKSAKGCQLIILPSCDGANYDRHVIVPPHLNAEAISVKIRDEICRLKQIDAEHEEDDNFDGGYTDADLARYVGSIGCLWVGKGLVCGENWD
jgi:hypothetical protein